MILHPLVAFRSCDDCRKWWYDEKTGEPFFHRGKKALRPEGTVPCEMKNSGCKKGHWKNPKTLNWRNQMALKFHQSCRAVNKFPDDAIVVKNARIIAEVERSCDRVQHLRELNYGLTSLTMGGGNAKR